MKVDRILLKRHFTQDDLPEWMCPTCNKSVLQLKNNSDFIEKNNSTTEIYKNEEHFEWTEDAKLVFTAILQCANNGCKETVIAVGSGYIREDYDTNHYGQNVPNYKTWYEPKFFYPPLNFFVIPDDTPEKVSKSIIESFALFFTNKSASANQIRIALEDLLTHMDIAKYNTSEKRLTLHKRIELLEAKYPNIKDLCMAIKWLGNDGSHSGDSLTNDDIFDAYDLMSYILDTLYDDIKAQLDQIANRINQNKGI